jgi:DNA-binding CsgD family transcriptional regulator
MELPPDHWFNHATRINDERGAGHLTATQRDVMKAIAALHLAGDEEPSNAKIAAYAQCSARTVRNAKRIARLRGLLRTTPRFTATGQTTNRHELLVPDTPCLPKPKPACKAGGKACRPRGKEDKKEAREWGSVDAAAALLARRKVIEARLMAPRWFPRI